NCAGFHEQHPWHPGGTSSFCRRKPYHLRSADHGNCSFKRTARLSEDMVLSENPTDVAKRKSRQRFLFCRCRHLCFLCCGYGITDVLRLIFHPASLCHSMPPEHGCSDTASHCTESEFPVLP